VAIDGSERASSGHPVSQDSQVSVINIDAVRFKNLLDLVHEALSCSFDAKHVIDLI